MLLLPTFNASLNPCPVGPASFSPHEKGRYCGQCQRVVQDFTQSADPVAELAAARAASPDGRVCGSFAPAQVAAPPLSRRLRWFLLALVLVVGQGLTAREALAQVRKAAPGKHAPARPRPKAKQPAAEPIPEPYTETITMGGVVEPVEPVEVIAEPPNRVYTYVEQMPAAPGGGGIAGIVAYIQKRIVWPPIHVRSNVEGKIFVSFTVGTDGRAQDAQITKGLESAFDAEVLRVVQGITDFTPGQQKGQPVPVRVTVPIIIKLE